MYLAKCILVDKRLEAARKLILGFRTTFEATRVKRKPENPVSTVAGAARIAICTRMDVHVLGPEIRSLRLPHD